MQFSRYQNYNDRIVFKKLGGENGQIIIYLQ
jgi:hypothetical protein